MFTCQAIKNGGSYLSEHLAANDYYAEGEHVIGQWVGVGAKLLGIEGREIEPKDSVFEALRTNTNPQTGQPLTARTSESRIAFYDFQCSAPKSVSIAAVTFGDTRLVEAHKAAVLVALGELEKFAGRRVREGEKAQSEEIATTGNIIAGAFTHDASRELEAQLHTHLVCANATFDPKEDRWFALHNGQMFGAIGFAGRVYQAELADRCRALGYEVREDRENGVVKGFELEGVTAEDCAKQSTRRKQIEAEIERFKAANGRAPSTAETHVIATETREKKLREITTPEVRAAQLAKYDEQDRARLAGVVKEAREGLRASRADETASRAQVAAQAVALSVEHLLERKATASRADVLKHALQENLGALTVGELRGALDASPLVVRLEEPGDERPTESALLTSTVQRTREAISVGCVEATTGKFPPLARGHALADTLGGDQKKAVEEILASTDGVLAMLGRAGAGKTFTLREIDRLARLGGVKTEYVAPTHAAKEVLREDGFRSADTVTALLGRLQRGEADLAGKLLVVDEAGMLSTKQGTEILRAAQGAGARVLLVGDEKQLLSVETGDWLGMLLKHSPLKPSVLSEIRRQRDSEYRSAMEAMSRGEVKDGLEKLDAKGWVHEEGKDYLTRAAEAYLARGDKRETAILVAPTWSEIDRLNEHVRARLGADGKLTGVEVKREALDVLDLTSAQRKVARNFEVGHRVQAVQRVPGLKRNEWDVVVKVDRRAGCIELAGGAKVDVRKHGRVLQVARSLELGIRVGDTLLLQGNDKRLGVINGERVRVARIDADGLLVKQTRGKQAGREVFLPKTYKTFVHGYAVTAEKSQGATVEHAVVAAARLDGRRTYVATSRGRATVEVHVPDKKAAVARVTNEIRAEKSSLDVQPLPSKTGAGCGKVQEPAQDRAEPVAAKPAESVAAERQGPPPLPSSTVAVRLKAFLARQHAQLVRAARSTRQHVGRAASRLRVGGGKEHSNTLER